MYDYLAVDIDYLANWETGARKQHALYISGTTLLGWVKTAAEDALSTAAGIAGAGTDSDPYQLGGIASWIGAWKISRTAQARHIYYTIAGRKIQKIARGGIKPGGFADGFYVRDTGFSGTDPTEGNIWNRTDGASYREFGKFIDQGNTISAMEGVVWSQRLTSTLRTILKGKTGAHGPARVQAPTTMGKGARWSPVDPTSPNGTPQTLSKTAARGVEKADINSALPMLSAAMFLAEPSRNTRAWVIGLMMLDLIGTEYMAATATQNARHLTLQRAFANPKRLTGGWLADSNTALDQAPLNWVTAQSKGNPKEKAKTITKMGAVGSPAVEGLYPPSPKWSGRTKQAIDLANDYIQQKEIGIVAPWLAAEFNRYVGRPVFVSPQTGGSGTRLDAMTADFGGESAMKGFGRELEAIMKQMIAKRATSFDTPGMLFR
ncbi:hypothetical protein C8J46_102575 [Sphingomonas sp. PP-F2F-A104-K0414]|uniref:hypothetical protein n=1 Tax=Sphingomonas sp. PP-F2F-A104-K0414 TaxID=2135661 RepID=UPI0010453F24|nr:hypothetical protein [Sphingomonas sp. PP-F2F-A104-K0414]TCQ00431.1 hypothetical protein C8J46_102575 [Sphingomonas sp. PP-F2F-A104-K0414]